MKQKGDASLSKVLCGKGGKRRHCVQGVFRQNYCHFRYQRGLDDVTGVRNHSLALLAIRIKSRKEYQPEARPATNTKVKRRAKRARTVRHGLLSCE